MKPIVSTVSRSWALAASMGLMVCGVTGLAREQEPAPATPEQVAFFEAKIRPVLVESCLPCHGADVQMSGLRLDSLAAMRKGGEKGAVLVPGDPAKSALIQAIHYKGAVKMPPSKPLKPEQVADLEAWVKMGAPWPAGNATAPKAEAKPLWSLQPVKKPAVPKVKAATWVKNPIDAFVLSRLEAKKQSPSAPADRRTLIRRLTYDLIGLPPTVEEVDAFVADKSPNAYDKLVDRLLASPRYGERWARHWLDVARYADTKGYVFEEDRNYPNAYTYRAWVIDAFNKDLPYDKFVTQQIAADRLTEVQQGDDKRPLAALGFLTIGRRFLNSVPDIIDDRIDVTMRGFQAFTVGCARCHDHKFDPIPTQDYYSLYGVFASSEESSDAISDKSVRDPWEQSNQRIVRLQSEGDQLVLDQTKRLRDLSAIPAEANKLSADVKGGLQSFREGTLPKDDQLRRIFPAFEPVAQTRYRQIQNELSEATAQRPPAPEIAMSMRDRANPGDSVVFKRGNPGNPGPVAPRRFLAALAKPGVEREHWTKGSGRLELAQSIASRENPLTARVFVNRVWQWHFGAGLVRTPSDFGRQGEKPTHPELLDYLASTFMENGWSIKKLHRLIVTSATYRQASEVPEAVFNADPDNRNLGRMNRRRLDLEEMRDAIVAATGQLDLTGTGGKSVDLWATPFTRRRAVYGFVERQNLPGVFRTFDFASPDTTSPRRFMTTVPQQALFFMNSPFAIEQARGVAERKDVVEAKDDAQRVRRLYRIFFDRLPDADELAMGLAYLRGSASAAVAPIWQYGFGGFDPAQGKVAFTPFANFKDETYRPTANFPDPALGYLMLNRQGGHPGKDAVHATVRRWTAPAAMTVSIEGTLVHGQPGGDGVRARIVSSRRGLLGEWPAFKSQAKTDLKTVEVQKGETLDFVVDPVGSDAFDLYTWTPIVRKSDGAQTWNAVQAFGPPSAPPLPRLALYAQALMMTNEFLFVD